MSDFFAMGGYGFYVWTSYGLFCAALIWDGLAPVLVGRRTRRQLGQAQRRAAARASRTEEPS